MTPVAAAPPSAPTAAVVASVIVRRPHAGASAGALVAHRPCSSGMCSATCCPTRKAIGSGPPERSAGSRCGDGIPQNVHHASSTHRDPGQAIDRYAEITDGYLVADQQVPRKQRHSNRRIWRRLVAEHGATCSEITMFRYVARRRIELGLKRIEVQCRRSGRQVSRPGQSADVPVVRAGLPLGASSLRNHVRPSWIALMTRSTADRIR